jgi:hypothetical protein
MEGRTGCRENSQSLIVEREEEEEGEAEEDKRSGKWWWWRKWYWRSGSGVEMGNSTPSEGESDYNRRPK